MQKILGIEGMLGGIHNQENYSVCEPCPAGLYILYLKVDACDFEQYKPTDEVFICCPNQTQTEQDNQLNAQVWSVGCPPAANEQEMEKKLSNISVSLLVTPEMAASILLWQQSHTLYITPAEEMPCQK